MILNKLKKKGRLETLRSFEEDFKWAIDETRLEITEKDVTDLVRDETVTDLVRDETVTDMVRDETFTNMVRDETVTDMVRGETVTDLVRDETVTDFVRDETVTDIVRDETVTDMVRDETVTDLVRDETVTGVVRDETVTDVVRYETVTDMVRDETVTDMVRDETITDMVRDETVTDLVRDETVTDMVRDETVTDVVRDETVTNVVRDKKVTDVFRDETVTDMVTDETVIDVVRDETVTDVVRDETVTDVVRDETVTDMVRDETVTDVVRDETVTDMVRDETVTDMVRDETVTDMVRDETVTDIVRDVTVTDIVRDETVTDMVTDETVTDMVTDETVTDMVTDETVTDVVRDETVTDVVRDETVTDVVRDETDTNVVRDETVTDMVRDETVINVVRGETVTDVVRDETVINVVRDKTVTDLVTDETVTDMVRDETVTDMVRDETVTNMVRDETVTDLVRDETVTDMVRGEAVTDMVRDETVTDMVRDETVTDVVRDETVTDVVRDETVKDLLGDVITDEITIDLVQDKTITDLVDDKRSDMTCIMGDGALTDLLTDELMSDMVLDENYSEGYIGRNEGIDDVLEISDIISNSESEDEVDETKNMLDRWKRLEKQFRTGKFEHSNSAIGTFTQADEITSEEILPIGEDDLTHFKNSYTKDSGTRNTKDSRSKNTENPGTRNTKDSETRNTKDSETRNTKDSETRNTKDSETGNPKDSETRNPKDSETRNPKDSETRNAKDSETIVPEGQEKVNENEIMRDYNNPNIYIQKVLKSNIKKSQQKKTGQRVYNSVHCCFYCKKFVHHIRPHLKVKHCHVKEVEDAFKDKTGTKLNLIRAMGDDLNNQAVITQGKGELLVSRRPKVKFTASDYGPCPNCREWVAKDSIKRHQINCSQGENSSGPQTKRNLILQSDMACGRLQSPASPLLIKDVFSKMTLDDISEIAKNDTLIIAVGEYWLRQNIDNVLERSHYASQRMRLSARLLIELRKQLGDQCTMSMWDFLKPQHFDLIVNAALQVALPSMDDETELKSPSNCLKLKYDLLRLTNFKWSIILKRNLPEEERKQCKNFLYLMGLEYKTKVTKLAYSVLIKRQFTKSREIPTPSDIEILNRHVSSELKTTLLNPEKENYRKVESYVQCRLLCYNKRRSGEIDAISLNSYRSRRKELSDIDESLVGELSDLERHLLDSQDLMIVRGKRGKAVPVIIPQDCQRPLEYLSNPLVRQTVGISSDNMFLFPNSVSGALRSYESLKTISSNLNLKNPENITSVSMRKYTATLSQVIDLNNNELGWLCKHLGHTKRVHKEHYQNMSGFIERVQISKLMLIQDLNLTKSFAGKKLNDVTFEDLLSKPDEDTRKEIPKVATTSTTSSTSNRNSQSDDDDEIIHGTSRQTRKRVLSSSDETEDVPQKKRKKFVRVRWTSEQITELKEYFKQHFTDKTTPRKAECLRILQKSRQKKGVLHTKTYTDIIKKISNMNHK